MGHEVGTGSSAAFILGFRDAVFLAWKHSDAGRDWHRALHQLLLGPHWSGGREIGASSARSPSCTAGTTQTSDRSSHHCYGAFLLVRFVCPDG